MRLSRLAEFEERGAEVYEEDLLRWNMPGGGETRRGGRGREWRQT